jgi:hypothetical protein
MREVYLWIAALFFLALGLPYVVRTLLEARILRRLRRGGVNAEAVIVSRRAVRAPYIGGVSYVRYRYRHQGQTYEREEHVGSGRSRGKLTGAKISVRYLPQNPHLARITGTKNQYFSTTLIFLAFTLLVVLVVVLILW